MKLYEQFGLTADGVSPTVQLRMLRADEEGLGQQLDDLGDDMRSILIHRAGVAVRYYLMGDLERAKQFAESAIPAATTYFFGDWRMKVNTDNGNIDPEWWHDKEGWMRPFSLGMMWASVLNNWGVVAQLCTYPDDRRGMDTVDANPALRQLYIDIAHYVQNSAKGKIKSRASDLDGVKWRGTQVLATCLEGISARNAAHANHALNEFFTQHHKRKKSDDVTDTISVNGTFMFHLARHHGIDVRLDPSLEHYIAKFPAPDVSSSRTEGPKPI